MSQQERKYAVRIALILLALLVIGGLAYYVVFSALTMPSIETVLLTPSS